jgi:Tol biopolymer transport system component
MCIRKTSYPYTAIITVLMLNLIVSACSPAPTAIPSVGKPSPVAAATDVVAPVNTAAKPTGSVLSAPTATETAPAAIPNITPTIIPPAENRQKPEDWQDWPIIPVISTRARQIYEAGLAAGTNPASFSKVGDCQAIKNVLLGMYDKSGGYSLRENDKALEETIQQFSGSFDRDGEAVQGGFNAASELTPLMSNPEVCEPGETPLECEVRVHNPSILLISLEVWWNGRSPAVYEKNMRQIIEYAIGKGILPILSTKADNVEGDHSINLTTARLAYEYDLPLWNWWRAAQSLPNHGLDPNRPDGFHISQEFAWPERSFTALQVLDAAWRSVRPETVQPTATLEPTRVVIDLVQPASPVDLTETPGATSSANPGLLPVDTQLFSNPSGFILMSVSSRTGETVLPRGIFLVDPAAGVRVSIASEGADLQAVSPSGRQILFNRGSDLYQAGLDGSQPVLLTNRFYRQGTQAAVFMPDGKTAVFLAEQDGSTILILHPLDGSGAWKRLSPAGTNPVAVYPSKETGRIFWENGNCPTPGSCVPSGVFVSGLDGSSMEFITGALAASISPDGKWLAFEDKTGDGKTRLNLASMDLKSKRPLENIGSQLLDFSWSPDGTRLSLLTLDRSDYSGQWLDVRNLVISTQDMGTKILPSTSGVNPRAVWSADGTSLLLSGTQQTETGYSLLMRVMDVTTGSVRDLTATTGFNQENFIYTTRIFWVPPVK